jgi:large subunit ribosomal protein L23
MRLYRLIKKPIITEKTSNMDMKYASYAFEVDKSATKIDIKKAISEMYGVEVASVQMLYTREKFKFGKKRGMQLRKASIKKAYITLKNAKDKIDFTITK